MVWVCSVLKKGKLQNATLHTNDSFYLVGAQYIRILGKSTFESTVLQTLKNADIGLVQAQIKKVADVSKWFR